MIFELAQDFHTAIAAMPRDHPKHRMLELLEEAVRRDIHFIDRHPTALFQCMWNSCIWNLAGRDRVFYLTEQQVRMRWSLLLKGGTIWDDRIFTSYFDDTTSKILQSAFNGGTDLYDLLLAWQDLKKQVQYSVPWFKSMRPPRIPVTSAVSPLFCDPQSAIIQIEMIPNGYMVIGTYYGRIYILDCESGKVVTELSSLESHKFLIDPEGRRIAWRRQDRSLVISELPFGVDITLNGLKDFSQLPWVSNPVPVFITENQLDDTTFFISNNRAVSLSKSKKELYIWDLIEKKLIGSFKLEYEVRLLGISPDGKKVITSDSMRPFTVRILDTTGKPPKYYIVADDNINCACFINEHSVVVGSSDRWCYKLNLDLEDADHMLWQSSSFIMGIMLSPCERLLVVDTGSYESFVYDTETGLPLVGCICHETQYHPQQGRLFEVVTQDGIPGCEVLINRITAGWLPHRFSFYVSGINSPIISGHETHIGTDVYIYRLQTDSITKTELPNFSMLWNHWGRYHINEFVDWLKAFVKAFQQSHTQEYAILLEQEASIYDDLGLEQLSLIIRKISADNQ